MRYALKNRRPGESYHTPAGFVTTDPKDGGARLTAAQKAYFEGEGYELVALSAPEPVHSDPPPTEESLARVAENAIAAAAVEAASRRVPTPKKK